MRRDPDGQPILDGKDATVEDLIEALSKMQHANYGRQGNGEKTLLRWLLGINGSLLVAAICGGIVMYGNQQATTATLAAMQKQIDQVQAAVALRMRGIEENALAESKR